MAFDKRVFREELLCPGCGVRLFVSEAYSRVLVLTSVVLGYSLPWTFHIQRLLFPSLGWLAGLTVMLALGIASAFAILSILVRVVPRLASPTLVLRKEDPFTRLNLAAERIESRH